MKALFIALVTLLITCAARGQEHLRYVPKPSDIQSRGGPIATHGRIFITREWTMNVELVGSFVCMNPSARLTLTDDGYFFYFDGVPSHDISIGGGWSFLPPDKLTLMPAKREAVTIELRRKSDGAILVALPTFARAKLEKPASPWMTKQPNKAPEPTP